MFKSIDEQTFLKAIEEKDYLVIKSNTISAIRNDPTFSGTEYKEIIDLLLKRVPEIFEEEKCFDFESHVDESKWDHAYFVRLTCWFEENFALSRVDEIKKVGQKVFKKTKTETGSASKGSNPSRPTKAPLPIKKQIPTAIRIAGIVAIMAALVLIVKVLEK